MPEVLTRQFAPASQILIVDDDQRIRQVLSRWLNGAGHTCAEAAGGSEALRQLESREFALVTLDINMPDVTGIELLPAIKASYPETEVVMLTGRGDSRTAIDALTQGASGYLIKPVELDELMFQVSRGLERRQLFVERREYTENLEEKVEEQTQLIRSAHEETIFRLVRAISARDGETGMHTRRVGLFSECLASAAGWPASEARQIRLAAPMHDVGKIGIPDDILQRPGRLLPQQREIMQRHTLIGAEMLSESSSEVLRLASLIARSHHEWWDGSGYPDGLAGEEIPRCARIVSIADVYDALTHDRVYRAALTEHEALAMMQEGCGAQFDPVLFAVFLDALPEIRRLSHQNPDS